MTTAPAGGRAGGGLRAWAPHVLTALLIWLGWQVVVGLLVQRSPVETAVRVAPSSGQVLSRAAEAELVAGRIDSARDLAGLALRAAPFDVRALRVLGLAVATTDPAAADDLLTLAGNWSLRDDPSHAWLIRRRLEQGDYAGAFGHADALARRRTDVHPRIFQLFTVAVAEDPRAAPHLIARLAPWPNWRPAYLESLRTGPQAPQVQATLALGLERTDGPLNDGELQTVYGEWLRQGRLPGLRELRRRLRRPPPAPIHDGGFEGLAGPTPFNWILEPGPGAHAEMSAGPDVRGKALFLETDGFSTRTVASQVLLLEPGTYSLDGRFRFEAGGRDPRFSWSIRCLETNAVIATWSPTATQDSSDWASARTEFAVPTTDCTTQWIELKTRRGPRRSAVVAWFDAIELAPVPTKTTGN